MVNTAVKPDEKDSCLSDAERTELVANLILEIISEEILQTAEAA